MIKNRVFLVVTPQQYDDPLSGNAKDIALELAQRNIVFYINLPLDIKSIITGFYKPEIRERLLRQLGIKKRIVRKNYKLYTYYPSCFFLSINWIKSRRIHKSLNWINNWLFASRIKRLIKANHIQDYVIFNDNLMTRGLYLKDHLFPEMYVYYIRDNFEGHPYFRRHGIRDQREHFRKADIVLANSEFLRKKAYPYNKRSYFVGQGIHLDRYNPENKGKYMQEFAKLQEPVVAYIGNLTTGRLDLLLLEELAGSMPHITFAFAGPQDSEFKESALHKMKNVKFLGYVGIEKWPDLMEKSAVTINPQLINDFTNGNYPRKIDEYLIFGKPVVATRTEFMTYFDEQVYLALGAEEWQDAIERAIEEDNPTRQEERKKFAANHTWANSTAEIFRYLKLHFGTTYKH